MSSKADFTTSSKTCTAAMSDWSQYYTLVDPDTIKAAEDCSVVVRSRQDNTGLIYVARNTSTSKINPFRLSPGEAIELKVKDVSGILVGAEVAGEKVDFVVEID